VAAGTNYSGATGTAQTFSVVPDTPNTPTITNIPTTGLTIGGSFTASVSTNGDGVKSVTSSTTSVCTVGGDGLSVTYVGLGTCSLTAAVAAGTNYSGATGTAQTFSIGHAPSLSTPANQAVYFALNSPIVSLAGIAAIRRFAAAVAAGHIASIFVSGYASESGPLAFNIALSRHRANAVAKILRKALLSLRVRGVTIRIITGGVRTVAPTDAGNRLAILQAVPKR
ncbi:MAG: hypothetical protein WCL17_03875, partial [Actinomycetota bacterium]